MAKKPPSDDNTFGVHIRELREDQGLSIGEAATGAGISAADWAGIEADSVMPRLRLIRPMAKVLGVKPYEVL